MLTTQERFLFGLFAVLAAVAIAIGYLMSGTGASILKDIMVFCGGAGMAYVLAASGSRTASHRDAEAAKERLRSLCNRSVQRLGLTASQTLTASTLVREHMTKPSESTAELIAALLENAAEQAQVSIGDLEEMAGAKISLDELVSDALSSMHEASEELPTDVRQKLSEIMKPLEQIKDTGGVSSSPVAVSCPKCNSRISVMLGDFPGSTVHSRCGSCFARVVLHRSSDGTVVAKPIGRPLGTVGPSPKTEVVRSLLEVTCPGCRGHITVTVKHNDPIVIVRNCFTCDERLYIDSERRILLRSEKRAALKAPTILVQGRIHLCCPSCMNTIRLASEPAGQRRFKTTCSQCTNLIEAFPIEEPQPDESATTTDARRAYSQGDTHTAAVKLGITLDRSETIGAAQTPTTNPAIQKANEGHLALARGEVEQAQNAYEEASQLGLYPVFTALNLAMVGVISGSPAQARASLSIIAAPAAGPFMRVQLELLKAVCAVEELGTSDLAALTDARSKCPEFELTRSPLQHLKSGLTSAGKYTKAVDRVFAVV